MASIRKRLVRSQLLLFAGSWLAFAAATYIGAHHEIEELFDAELAQAAGILEKLVIRQLEAVALHDSQLAKEVFGHKYERSISFQIWQGDELLLRSQSAPPTPMSPHPGYSDERIDETTWRVFALRSENSAYMIYAAERYAVRNELIGDITQSALLPLAWALPVSGLLIWLGIGQGLAPLRRITAEVAQRSPRQLEPIDTSRVPDEVKPLTHSLNNLLSRLRAAFEKERAFTSDAAHELRTPLASIKTQTQVALRAQDAKQRKQALEQIVRAVDRGAHLVQQMLALARLEPETINATFQPVDLAAVCTDVISELAPLAAEKSIDLGLNTTTTADGAYVINGYGAGLAMLVSNLIDNAIRYTPTGGRVMVELEQDNAHVTLAVTDTGIGIPAADRERVFDRFYRRADTQSYGSGLGLSIVQRLAQLHQADVLLADASVDGGLAVHVTFARPPVRSPQPSGGSQTRH